MRRGTHHSPESRAKISRGMRGTHNRRGKPQTAEARARISFALRRYHALRRAGLWP